jgi:hypothetical protein
MRTVIALFIGATLMLLLADCSAQQPTALTLAEKVDQAVAGDGTPLEIPPSGVNFYPDAFALVQADCQTMADPSTTHDPAQWLAAHVNSNFGVPGEGAALKVGVPLVCPDFISALAVLDDPDQSDTSAGADPSTLWTVADQEFLDEIEQHAADITVTANTPPAFDLAVYGNIACVGLATGQPASQVAQGLLAHTGFPEQDAPLVVQAAVDHLCGVR